MELAQKPSKGILISSSEKRIEKLGDSRGEKLQKFKVSVVFMLNELLAKIS